MHREKLRLDDDEFCRTCGSYRHLYHSIHEAAHHNSIVHVCLTMFLRGDVSWEYALVHMVLHLAQAEKVCIDRLNERADGESP